MAPATTDAALASRARTGATGGTTAEAISAATDTQSMTTIEGVAGLTIWGVIGLETMVALDLAAMGHTTETD